MPFLSSTNLPNCYNLTIANAIRSFEFLADFILSIFRISRYVNNCFGFETIKNRYTMKICKHSYNI